MALSIPSPRAQALTRRPGDQTTPSTLKGPPAFPSGSDIFPVPGAADLANLNGRQKAALLLYCLGTEVSVEVLKHLSRDEARMLSQEIAKTKLPSERALLQLLQEFNHRFQSQMDKVKEAQRKEEEELASKMPFKSLRRLDASEIASILSDEQPQTIALVLSYLNPDQAADVLASFPRDLQSELVERIATIQEIPNELVRKIEAIIDEKAKAFISQESAPTSIGRRMETIATLLQRTSVVSDDLLERIGEANPTMAKELRLKAFTFEDILSVDDRILQKALSQIEPGTLALALKIASEALTDRILNGVDPQVREDIKDQRDLMGPKTLMEIEEAQKEIIEAVKRAMA
jgi:flagellar motor switch protein FliG